MMDKNLWRKTWIVAIPLILMISIFTVVATAQIIAYDFKLSLSRNSGRITFGLLVPMELAKVTVTPTVGVAVFEGLIKPPEHIFVTLSCSGQPSGVDIWFEPNPVDIVNGQPATSSMTITASYTAAGGTYTLYIIGAEEGGIMNFYHQITFQLEIISPIPPQEIITVTIVTTVSQSDTIYVTTTTTVIPEFSNALLLFTLIILSWTIVLNKKGNPKRAQRAYQS